VGSLGFEPRIANAPGWYTKPSSTELTQDTQISPSIRRPQHQQEIINTLINLTNSGKAPNTVRGIASALKITNQQTNIADPEQVRTFIANLQKDAQTKNRYALAYEWFCKTNNIQWKKPYFKWERKIPMIPTTENIDKIISASSTKYATIFTILKETGLEAHELATTQRKDIDQERGIINALGCKGHNSRSFKLKPATAELLRKYLSTYTNEKPFPNAHALGESWRNT
jgi:integrase